MLSLSVCVCFKVPGQEADWVIQFLVAALAGLATALPINFASVPERRSTLRHGVPRSLFTRNGAGSVVTNPTALSFYDPTFSDGTGGYSTPNTYECYSGPAANFPPMSTWMNFDAMFNRNQQYSLVVVGDTGPEQGAIYNAIVSVSQQAKVDARVILAVIIQEVCFATGSTPLPSLIRSSQ